MAHVIALGDLVSGFEVIGEFPNETAAHHWATREFSEDTVYTTIPMADPASWRAGDPEDDTELERIASELAAIDNYNPNDYPPDTWPKTRDAYRERAKRVLLAMDGN